MRKNEFGYVEVDEFPIEKEIPLGTVFAIKETNNTTSYTHGIHKFAGKFIPQIPQWAIKRYLDSNTPKRVIDPFCGSGTTLLEAALAGHIGYGLDIDPLARLISKVKTTPIASERLRLIVEDIKSDVRKQQKGTFRPQVETLSHWFNEKNIEELSAIRSVVDKYVIDTDIYNFLIVVFSSIIRRASNADDQSQKTYVSHTLLKDVPSAKELFLKALEQFADRIMQMSVRIEPSLSCIIPNDMTATKFRFDDPFDLAVTSPPYIKSIDYIYNQMVEYFWIGDLWSLDTQGKQRSFKTNYIGTEQIDRNESGCEFNHIPELESKIQEISNRNKKLGLVTRKYFTDISRHFAIMHSQLRENAHYVFVIGNSTVAGENVPTHIYLSYLAQSAGFAVDTAFGYRIRRHYMKFPRAGRGGIILIDWVLDLRRTSSVNYLTAIPSTLGEFTDGGQAIIRRVIDN